jgi:hypothetical protein
MVEKEDNMTDTTLVEDIDGDLDRTGHIKVKAWNYR